MMTLFRFPLLVATFLAILPLQSTVHTGKATVEASPYTWQHGIHIFPHEEARILVEASRPFGTRPVRRGQGFLQAFTITEPTLIDEFWFTAEVIQPNTRAHFVLYRLNDPQAQMLDGEKFIEAPIEIPTDRVPDEMSLTFSPELPAADEYEVFIRYIALGTRATNAPVEIRHADGKATLTVNQRTRGGEWVSLGRFPFRPGEASVKLSNRLVNGIVAFEALGFSRKSLGNGEDPEIIIANVTDNDQVEMVGEWRINTRTGFYGDQWLLDLGQGTIRPSFLRVNLTSLDGRPLQLQPGSYAFGLEGIDHDGEGEEAFLIRQVPANTAGQSGGFVYHHTAHGFRGTPREITFAVLAPRKSDALKQDFFKNVNNQSRPSMFFTARNNNYGLRTLDDLRRDIQRGFPKTMWTTLLEQVERDKKEAPLILEGNLHWQAAFNISQRITRNALAAVVMNDPEAKRVALEQIIAVYDPLLFPRLRDNSHNGMEVDLRGGTLVLAIALAYDWMYPMLTEKERLVILSGMNNRFIQPYLTDIKSNVWWVNAGNNWTTVICGNFGIAGMILREVHPDSARLVEIGDVRMDRYLESLGSDGSFNETPFYGNALVRPVEYYAAKAFYDPQNLKENPLEKGRVLHQSCVWMTYAYVPPGRVMKFGDAFDVALPLSFFPQVAQVSRDGVLQWVFLNYPKGDSPRRDLVGEILGFDGRVKPVNPQGVWPLGRTFGEHGKLVSSRSSWSPRPEESVSIAYGKAGREGHGANDVGQFCLDGYGEPLIVSLGGPSGGYPGDFFGPNREKYYNASTWGQNLFVFDREEQIKQRNRQPVVGEFIHTEFDDDKGGAWQIDLTPVYDGARKVTRTVIHLLPDVAVVLDEARLNGAKDISMRWHPANRVEPTPAGRFTVVNGMARLEAQMVPLGGARPEYRLSNHEYVEPYHMNRNGHPLGQPREPFIETSYRGDRFDLLTLFSVQKADQSASQWRQQGNDWVIETPEGRVVVSVNDRELRVSNRQTGKTLAVPRR